MHFEIKVVHMKAKTNSLPFAAFAAVIIFATLARIITPAFLGHSVNFSPIDAIALFSGAYLTNRFSAFSITLLSIWTGDLFINRIYFDHWTLFYQGFYWQYGCYLLITLLGSALTHRLNVINLIAASLSSSLLFFVISNFGVWFSGILYPLTMHGLVTCYVAAIPFFENTLLSDLFYSILFFQGAVLAQKTFSSFGSYKTFAV